MSVKLKSGAKKEKSKPAAVDPKAAAPAMCWFLSQDDLPSCFKKRGTSHLSHLSPEHFIRTLVLSGAISASFRLHRASSEPFHPLLAPAVWSKARSSWL